MRPTDQRDPRRSRLRADVELATMALAKTGTRRHSELMRVLLQELGGVV